MTLDVKSLTALIFGLSTLVGSFAAAQGPKKSYSEAFQEIAKSHPGGVHVETEPTYRNVIRIKKDGSQKTIERSISVDPAATKFRLYQVEVIRKDSVFVTQYASDGITVLKTLKEKIDPKSPPSKPGMPNLEEIGNRLKKELENEYGAEVSVPTKPAVKNKR